MHYEIKAATFNGNVVTGNGRSIEQAYEAAQKAAFDLGSCIRKVIKRQDRVTW